MPTLDAMSGALLTAAISPSVWTIADRTTHRPITISVAESVSTTVVLAAVGAFIGGRLGLLGALTLLPVLVLGGGAALVDLRQQRLPDPLTAALAATTLVAAAVALTVAHRSGRGPWQAR